LQAKEKEKHLDSKIAIANENLKDYNSNVTLQRQELEKLKKDLKNINVAINAHDETIRATNQKKGRNLGEDELKEYNKLREQINSQTFTESSKLKSLERQLTCCKESIQRFKSTLENQQQRSQVLLTDKAQYESRKSKVLISHL
jgi:hypothetical protein